MYHIIFHSGLGGRLLITRPGIDVIDEYFKPYWKSGLFQIQPLLKKMISFYEEDRPREISGNLRSLFPEVAHEVDRFLQTVGESSEPSTVKTEQMEGVAKFSSKTTANLMLNEISSDVTMKSSDIEGSGSGIVLQVHDQLLNIQAEGKTEHISNVHMPVENVAPNKIKFDTEENVKLNKISSNITKKSSVTEASKEMVQFPRSPAEYATEKNAPMKEATEGAFICKMSFTTTNVC